MFKRNLLSSAIILAGTVWGSAALADTQPGTQFSSAAEITKVSEWVGKDVQDNEGNEIGEISDFAINLNDGSVVYAVVGLSGLFNNKAIAVPLAALSTSAESDDDLTLQVSQSEWKSAETFTGSDWPLKPSLAAGKGAAVASTGTEASTNEATDSRWQQSEDQYDQASGSVSGLNRDAEFDTMDADGDGYLSTEELLQATRGAPATDGTETADQDQDGRISRSEFAAFESAGQESRMRKESSADDRYGQSDAGQSDDPGDTDDLDVDDRPETSE